MTIMKRLLPGALLVAATASAQTPPLSAAASDPIKMGWMQGFPPPAEKQIRHDNSSMWFFPRTRWSFSHWRELVPTTAIRRGPTTTPLPRAERKDIDAITFTPLGGASTITWEQSLAANYTDGIVVLHRGRIVYERYLGAGGPDNQHVMFSVTKSFIGTLAETLVAEGKLDPARTIASYVPELATSGYGDATVRQVMDMRTSVAFDEAYAGSGKDGGKDLADMTKLSIATGAVPPQPGYSGPTTITGFLAAIGKTPGTPHGGDFVYRTTNTDVLAWVLVRVTGEPIAQQIQARYWSKMAMEQPADLQVDRIGTPFTGGGMSASLRDLARFGEMIRLGGRWNGQQIVPPAAIKAIMTPGDVQAFAAAKYPGLDGGSYASQWWHRASGQTMAVGIHGQGIYIDPKAEMVIARFGSYPVATNRVINPTTLPAYDAIAALLMR